jgi:AcrR family transcriptional regulator
LVLDRAVVEKQPHRGNRHGRSEAAREAILRAADDLLVEKGFAGVTVEGIARAAGVAKQTVYRWWSSKTDVLMDAFLEDAAEDLAPSSGRRNTIRGWPRNFGPATSMISKFGTRSRSFGRSRAASYRLKPMWPRWQNG